MLGLIFVYSLFFYLLYLGLKDPSKGLMGYYGWVILEPEWNWRWAVDAGGWQKWIFISAILGWLLQGCRIQPLHSRSKQAIFFFIAFLALAYVSGTQTVSERYTDYYMGIMWKIVLGAVLAACLIDTPKKLLALIVIVAIAQGYSAYRINEQYFQDGFSLFARRDWGTKGDNNLYSNLTLPCIACSLAIAFFHPKKPLSLLCGAIAILQIHQIMLLESRGAMLAGCVMIFLTIYYMPKSAKNIRLAFLSFVAGAVLAGPSVVDEFMSSFDPVEQQDTSAQSRWDLWKAGWAMTKDYPLLGVGPYAGQTLVHQYDPKFPGVKGLHNLFFEISTGCGVPAVTCYLLFFLIPFISAVKLERRIGGLKNAEPWLASSLFAVLVGIPGYWTGSMFSSGALGESGYLVAIIGIATLAVHRQQTLSNQLASQPIQGEPAPLQAISINAQRNPSLNSAQ